MRKTKLYKNLDSYTACSIVEGFSGEEESQENQLIAWQFLHDTRIAYKLQGWYGRTATSLIESKLIKP